MKNFIEAMKRCALFAELSEKELQTLAFSLSPRSYSKDTFISVQGEYAKGIGLVIAGKIHIVREDFLGNREILAEAESGDIFGEVYGILTDEPQRVSVVAASDCQVVFFSMEHLLADSAAHGILMQNLLRVVARKNLYLTAKMSHLSQRSIREKVISYLSEQASRQGGMHITIPFDRQQLADYLAVERSALSRELSRMRAEGIIDFHKNVFRLR